ncbi:MAG: hypothetical protein NZ874_02695 [Fimbriimonadales bacterium]|nr:hypothetical protein [Fimbriimonadales bacterium]
MTRSRWHPGQSLQGAFCAELHAGEASVAQQALCKDAVTLQHRGTNRPEQVQAYAHTAPIGVSASHSAHNPSPARRMQEVYHTR